MKVTIYDVAKHAQVSISTVSRVLNGKDRVKESTKLRIWDAIETLGFHPNLNASGLAKAKTRMIGLLLPRFDDFSYTDEYTMDMLNGLQKKCVEFSYNILIINQRNLGNSEYMDLINGKKIDGLIAYTSAINLTDIDIINKMQFPLVTIGEITSPGSNCHITHREKEILNLGLESLIDNGHSNIGIVYFAADENEQKRKEAVLSELFKLNGLSFSTEVNTKNCAPYDTKLRKAITPYIKNSSCTAYITDCVYYASIISGATSYNGLRVPEDISIITVEHCQDEADNIYPPINGILFNSLALGKKVATEIINIIEGTDYVIEEITDFVITDRHSVSEI